MQELAVIELTCHSPRRLASRALQVQVNFIWQQMATAPITIDASKLLGDAAQQSYVLAQADYMLPIILVRVSKFIVQQHHHGDTYYVRL